MLLHLDLLKEVMGVQAILEVHKGAVLPPSGQDLSLSEGWQSLGRDTAASGAHFSLTSHFF